MEQLRIGVVGCGAIGRAHIERITNRLAGGKIVAVSDMYVEGAHKVGDPLGATVYINSTDLVNDPDVDAIICATPAFAHKETVIQALESGKPIFCEKPLTTTAEDSLELANIEMELGTKLIQVGFMRRYDECFQQVKDLLDSGSFGAPLYIKCSHWLPEVDDGYTSEMSVYDTAIHEIDAIHWLLEDEYVDARVVVPRQTTDKNPDLIDPQLMFIRCKSDVIAMIEVFSNCKFGYDVNCQIVCENGVIDLPRPPKPTIRQAGNLSVPLESSWENRWMHAYDEEIQQWIDAVRAGTLTGSNAWDGVIANVTADALVRAQKNGGHVEKIEIRERPDFYK